MGSGPNLQMLKGEEQGRGKGSTQPRMLVAPGHGVTTVGHRQAGASASAQVLGEPTLTQY